jgi:signal transduction histidine kinase
MHQEDQDIIITTENPTDLTDEEMQHIGTIGYSTKPSGSGLGISITRTICQRHGGRLMISLRNGLFVATCILPKTYRMR